LDSFLADLDELLVYPSCETAKISKLLFLAGQRGSHTIRTVLGAGVRHRDSQYLNNRLEQDHPGVKGRYGSMRGFKSPRSAGEFWRVYDKLLPLPNQSASFRRLPKVPLP
jgi:transposase-like protein